jgi:hypothetical protein
VERRLDHPPLTFPKFALAHHEAIAEEQANPLYGLTLLVVLPVVAEDIICVLRVADYINVRTVDRRLINVSELFEVNADPAQEILGCVVLLGRARRNQTTSYGHLQ